ncbi:unnamed protein product [Cyberlindnera jadinii]|uniref:Uncharacterized protein n=1 Tax=Cyberlindnera jadinii (strain ATCC 18201 / CBS 1600 / BCRC 20928 / JCM 3617 / NBRC 0987 / NRRL Y-1542) TaxID=983966 RepID=A0A0H5C962_CYBJN|nr:unnamed protein product [Cyberlindnera jadinii]
MKAATLLSLAAVAVAAPAPVPVNANVEVLGFTRDGKTVVHKFENVELSDDLDEAIKQVQEIAMAVGGASARAAPVQIPQQLPDEKKTELVDSVREGLKNAHAVAEDTYESIMAKIHDVVESMKSEEANIEEEQAEEPKKFHDNPHHKGPHHKGPHHKGPHHKGPHHKGPHHKDPHHRLITDYPNAPHAVSPHRAGKKGCKGFKVSTDEISTVETIKQWGEDVVEGVKSIDFADSAKRIAESPEAICAVASGFLGGFFILGLIAIFAKLHARRLQQIRLEDEELNEKK